MHVFFREIVPGISHHLLGIKEKRTKKRKYNNKKNLGSIPKITHYPSLTILQGYRMHSLESNIMSLTGEGNQRERPTFETRNGRDRREGRGGKGKRKG